jgi:hypothetical protein
MSYSVDLLKTVADCDLKLAAAAKDRKDMDVKKFLLEKKQETADVATPEIEAAIIAAQGEIGYLEGLIVTIPDGDLKDAYKNKLRNQESKLFSLKQRLANYGASTILGYEFDIQCLERDLQECDAFIAEINARKAEL